MKVMYIKVLVLTVVYFISIGCLGCSKIFAGDAFLLKAHNKGINPSSTCYTADLPKNSFYAFPTKKCMIVFDSSSWLVEGWVFKDIEGKGRFTASKENDAIKVVIEKKGGFTLKTVTISSSLSPDKCKNANLADVL
ncbi:MAG: hypothetical protein KUG60_00975 [Gammaproteobacteria bacterium]|nr:hypothetical protein [Gammaproteobacteria bacterium]